MFRELNAAERTLLYHIASEIKEHPDKYREAGKWLNRYYDDDKLCLERRKLELIREIQRIEKGDVDFEGEEELFLPELKEELKIESPPSLWKRLAYALEDLWFNYRMGGVLAEEDAKAILIIAWVATDAEANKDNLNITKFADWPWKRGKGLGKHTRMGLIHDLFLARGPITSRSPFFFEYEDEDFLRLVFVAWHTLFAGTVKGAIIIKEMRRALVGVKRLLGTDEKENTDTLEYLMASLGAEKPTATEQGKMGESAKQIPPERRSTPLSLTRMAQYWGGEMTTKKLRAMIDKDTLKVIPLSRQMFIFDTKYLPAEVISKVKR